MSDVVFSQLCTESLGCNGLDLCRFEVVNAPVTSRVSLFDSVFQLLLFIMVLLLFLAVVVKLDII